MSELNELSSNLESNQEEIWDWWGNSGEIILVVGTEEGLKNEGKYEGPTVTVIAELCPVAGHELTEVAQTIVDAVNKQAKLIACLKQVITAAEIIDGQSYPPAYSDVEYLQDCIVEARALVAEIQKGKKQK